MALVPRVRQRWVDTRRLFACAGALAGAAAWATFFFVYDLGGTAFLIAAMVGFGTFVVCEAVFTVIAFVRGWRHRSIVRVRDAIEGLLSAVLR